MPIRLTQTPATYRLSGAQRDPVRWAVHDPEAGFDQADGRAPQRADRDQSKPTPGATAMRKLRSLLDGLANGARI